MSDHPSSELQGVFNRPFTEQVAFFRRKLGKLVPTQRWDDIEREAHDQAFMVAGAAKADLLTDLAAATDKAIAEGRGIEEFRRDFRAIVKRHGWTGWTGEGSVKGEAWRVRTIYRINTYTSYAAGRHAQLTAGSFPLWVYRHGGSLEPRPEHLYVFNGLVLPPDHPFWATHYPPSDWGCSCYVVGARSAAGARRLGGDPDKTLPPDWNARDPKTGAPIGIGRGWDYAPGASVSGAVQALAGKVRHWDYAMSKAFMDELPPDRADELARAYRALPSTADDARRFAQRVYEPKPDLPELPPVRTMGRLSQAQVAAIGAADLKADGFDFALAADELAHVRDEHGNAATERARGQRAVAPDDFARLPALLNGGVPRLVGRSRGHNQPVLEISRMIDGEEWVTRWELWQRRRSLVLLNLFVRTGERT